MCSKRWIWEQYDYSVRTNTTRGPGADAAILRIKETGTSVAMSLDGLRAWIGLVERKLTMRTRVFLVLVAIAIGGAGAGIVLAIDAQDSAVTKGDLQTLRDELAGNDTTAAGLRAGGGLQQGPQGAELPEEQEQDDGDVCTARPNRHICADPRHGRDADRHLDRQRGAVRSS